MTKRISRLWLLGPPVAIVLSATVYYAMFGSVRHWVDARFPWVRDHIGSLLPSREEASTAAAKAPARIPNEPPPEPPKPIAPPVAPTFFAPDGTVDLRKLAEDRSAWPQTVVLKTAREFPAVVDGKVMGKVEVPAGTETKLVSIKDGKLGVEYRGGGAWLTVEETDLPQRLRR